MHSFLVQLAKEVGPVTLTYLEGDGQFVMAVADKHGNSAVSRFTPEEAERPYISITEVRALSLRNQIARKQ